MRGVLPLNILHLADLHLGKLVHDVSMTADQEYVLMKQLIREIEEDLPDVVVIAGDIYDRPVPSTEAIDLFDRLLQELVLKLKVPVLAIAGNHDSAGRLHFASSILQASGLHIAGELTADLKPVVMNDAHGEVHFYLVPYADPVKVRYVFEDTSVRTHDDAMRVIVNKIKETMNRDVRNVFVGHAFVTPTGEAEPNTSDSERVLEVGGAEHVNAAHFADFDYVALGHLHRAHAVGSDRIRYAGSPLKYSISEESHKKGYLRIELGATREIEVKQCLLQPLRDMRRVEGLIAEILLHEQHQDYVFVTLLDPDVVLSPMEKVRSVFPNAMHVERKQSDIGMDGAYSVASERKGMSNLDLFKAFYHLVSEKQASEETVALYVKTYNEVNRTEGDFE